MKVHLEFLRALKSNEASILKVSAVHIAFHLYILQAGRNTKSQMAIPEFQ